MKILIIGKPPRRYTMFKSIEAVRTYVENYSAVMQSENLLLGDLSFLSQKARSVLLKFIEEKVKDIECFTSKDNLGPTLMSRFDRIIVNDKVKVGEDDFETYLQFVENKDQNIKYDLDKEFVSRSAPYLNTYLLYKRLPLGVVNRIGNLL